MAENVTLAPVSSFTNDSSAVATTNANNTLVEIAFADCLSLKGGLPNSMQSNLDMNNNQILNLPAPATVNSPLRLVDVPAGTGVPIASVPPVGTSGAVVGLLNANKTDSGNNTFSGNNSYSGTSSFTGLITAANAGPTWASYSGNFDFIRVTLNNYPVGAEFGNNAVPIASVITGAIEVPASAAGGNANFGIAGYARTASTSQGGVGLFGQGLANADGVSVWGGNFVISNAPLQGAAVNSGHNNVVMYGIEIDVNLVSNGGTPNVPTRGIYLVSGTTATTLGLFDAIDIDAVGTPWKIGTNFNDGVCSIAAINVGATGTGNNVGSMPILLNGRDSGGTAKQASIQTDPGGDLVLSPATGAVFSVNGLQVLANGGTTAKSFLASGTAGVGYATGAGGAVTQATNKSTGVTLNTVSGTLTTSSATAMAASSQQSFTFTNSNIAATDTVSVSTQASGATALSYYATSSDVAAGSCTINLIRTTLAGNLSEAVKINFNIIKGVSS